MSAVTKRPEVTTEEFRRFMRDDYGRAYQSLPQVRGYRQFFLSPPSNGSVSDDDGPHAIVQIAFDSPDAMRAALDNDVYRDAVARRAAYMARTDVRVLDLVVELA